MNKVATRHVSWIIFLAGLLSLAKICNGLVGIFSLTCPETQCFSSPPIGCFPTTEPFTNTGGVGPEDPEVIPTYFYFHRFGKSKVPYSWNNITQVLKAGYDPLKKTIFIVHGFMEHSENKWVLDMISALHTRNDTNIFTVDWRAGSFNVNFYQSVANTRVAGAVLALALQNLGTLSKDLSSFHLVGFSLGAHVAGYAGSRVDGLGRITGLDPAGMMFEGYSPEVRLDATDAILVDVIHTDGEDGLGFGTMQPMGDVDFYPNGGNQQPECPCSGRVRRIYSFLLFVSTMSEGHDLICSHARSHQLFTASINKICPTSSMTLTSRRHKWARRDREGILVSEEEDWLPCKAEADCPHLSYDLELSAVTNFKNNLLYQNRTLNGQYSKVSKKEPLFVLGVKRHKSN